MLGEDKVDYSEYDMQYDETHKSTSGHYDSMTKHLNYMLTKCRNYSSEKYPLPYNIDDVSYENVCDYKFVGKVVHFFGYGARTRFKDTGTLLSYKSADDYLSAFKTYMERKFRDKDTPKPLMGRFWSTSRDTLRRIKTDQFRAGGKRLSTPKETASSEDVWTIFAMAIWCNTFYGAMFHAIFTMCVQAGGRISEVGTVRKSSFIAKVSQ